MAAASCNSLTLLDSPCQGNKPVRCRGRIDLTRPGGFCVHLSPKWLRLKDRRVSGDPAFAQSGTMPRKPAVPRDPSRSPAAEATDARRAPTLASLRAEIDRID